MKLLTELLQIFSLSISGTTPQENLPRCLTTLIVQNAASFDHQVNLFSDVTNATEDLLESVLLGLEGHGGITTINLAPYDRLVDFNFRQLVVWIVDALQPFDERMDAIQRRNFEFHGPVVVILKGKFTSGRDSWVRILERFWGLGVTKVVLMVQGQDSEQEVSVVGYEPFRAECCRCVEPMVVNTCRKGVFVNGKIDELWRNNVEQMHGCSLSIGTFTRSPFIEVLNGSDGNLRLGGEEGEMLATISKRMNFTIEVTVPTDGRTWGQIYPNGSGVGAMGLVVQNQVDCTIGGYVPYPKLLKFTSPSFGYYTTDFVFVVPEELDPISSLGQLVSPLEVPVWIVLLAVCGTLYVVILASSCPLVGYFNHHPLLTLFRVIIGDSLPSHPRGNFFRFLMFLWLYHGLIIRESYKGSMISHLTEKRHLIDISTLQAMEAGGYRFAVTTTLNDLLLEETFRLDGTVILLSDEEYARGFERVIQRRERIALISIPEEIVEFNRRHPMNLNFHMAGEKLLSYHFCVYFRRSSPLVRGFNRQLRRLLAAGLVSKWKHELLNPRYLTVTLADEPVTVLTNGHLFSGYVFFGGGVVLASVVFLLEVASGRRRKVTTMLSNIFSRRQSFQRITTVSVVMETIELFKVIGKRVTKLPPLQQDEIIETVLGMIDASERMNRSSALRVTSAVTCQPNQQQQLLWDQRFNLTKSVSSFTISSSNGVGGGSKQAAAAAALTSSPSNVL